MKDNINIFLAAFFGGTIGIFIMALINGVKEKTTPQAIDVYRDKTTLQITYRDSIAIDTIVVFKEKKH